MARGQQSDTPAAEKPKGRQPKAPEGEQSGGEAAGGDKRRRACRVRAGTLRAALKDVAAIVEPRATIPILSHVHLTAIDGRIVLVGSNLDLWAQRECATVDHDGGAEWIAGIRGFAAAIPAKPFADILGEIDPDATVEIARPGLEAASAEEAAQAGGQVTLAAGRSRFRLHSLPPADFPMPPGFAAASSFEMRCTALADAFARVEHAISTEETRYYLNGIFIHPHEAEGEPGDLRFAATDGHRLARLRVERPEGAASWPPAILMRQTIGLLDKLLGAAAKASDKEHKTSDGPTASLHEGGATVLVEIAEPKPGALLRFSLPDADGGEIVVTAKSIDGTFPDYQRVIPADPPHVATLDRAALLEGVRRVGVLTSDKTRAVKAAFSADKLELVVTTPELGEAREELPCAYDGPEIAIGFNGLFWREALAALACDSVTMAFHDDPGGPVLLRAASADGAENALVQVLMPMRVA